MLSIWLDSVERARDLRDVRIKMVDIRHEEHGSFGEKFLEAFFDSSDFLLSSEDNKEVVIVGVAVRREVVVLLGSCCCSGCLVSRLVGFPRVQPRQRT